MEADVTLCYSFGPWLATKDHAVALSPLPSWSGEENGKKKAKLVVWDKGSLTEQLTKWTVTTITLIRKIYKTNSEMHRATLTAQRATHSRTINLPPASSPTRNQAWRHMVSNTPFVWPFWVSWPGCVPPWLLVKINPALAEPRTLKGT